MQSGERYGMPPADMPPFTTGAPSRGSHDGGGGAANALSHLFGHQSGTDLSGLHSLHLHSGGGGHRGAPSSEQQYISPQQLQLELNQHQQLHVQLAGANVSQQGGAAAAAPNFLLSSGAQPGLLHHGGHLPSFFRTCSAISGAQQHQDRSSLPHSFFMGGGAHSAAPPAAAVSSAAPEQFKLLNFNQISERGDHEEHSHVVSNTWSEDETAALIKVCSDMDSSTAAVANDTSLWEEVARKLQEMGYQRSPRKCKAKFESMPQGYDSTVKGKLEGRGGGSQNQELVQRRREQESSSEFSSEGGHADDVELEEEEVDDEEDDDEAKYIDLHERPHETINYKESKTKKRKLGTSGSSPSYSSWAPSKDFFERLTRDIMEKQESLHRSFLETLERKDRERALREEAYRRQEAARLDREQELRAQEVSIAACRDAALISFLEKATGQALPPGGLPKMAMQLGTAHAIPPRSSCTSNGGAASAAAAGSTDAAALALQSSHDHHFLHNQAELQDAVDMYNSDLNTKRWPKVEVHALIRLRSGMEPRFREAGPKAHLWQEISASMACLGFIRSPKRCKEKWENINKYFKKTKDSSKKRPENAKTCPYFHQLDTLYQRGILASSSSGGNGKAFHGKSGDSTAPYNMQADDAGLVRPLMGSKNMQTSDHREESAEQQQGRSNEINNDHDIRIMDGTTEQSSIFATDMYNSNQSSAGSGAAAAASSILPLSYQHHHHHYHPQSSSDGAGVLISNMPTSIKKSMQLEMFVKDILDLQQQQHQKLMDEYDRMEQAHELREMERAQQIKAAAMVTSTQDTAGHHEGAGGTSHDNATLMALVHKLAGESADLTMSAPSTSMD